MRKSAKVTAPFTMTTGYTREGQWLEREILGEPDKKILIPEIFETDHRWSVQEAIRLVKTNQCWDPSDPKPRIANDLHTLVAEGLGIEDYDQLGFFTAVNSPLDRLFKTDGFFQLANKGVKTPWARRQGLLIPFDLTFDNKEYWRQNHNAVQLIGQHLLNDEGEINKKGIEAEAKKIADAFLAKIDSQNRHYFF